MQQMLNTLQECVHQETNGSLRENILKLVSEMMAVCTLQEGARRVIDKLEEQLNG